MRALEISINGELKSVAGSASAESITVQVLTVPRLGDSHLLVSGDIGMSDEPNAEATWLSVPLRVGDVVSVRLVEHASPTAPTLGRHDPGSGATDGLPVLCAFCGASSDRVEGGMLASKRALICRPCVRWLHSLVVDESGA